MKITITHKLILAFVALTLLILIATLGLARWSFKQGFLDYVNALEQQRLALLRDDLAEQYRNRGPDWNWLQAHEFARLLRRAGDISHLPQPADAGGRGNLSRGSRPPPPDGPPQFRPLWPPTALFNNRGEWLAGDEMLAPQEQRITLPIQVNGVTVGSLQSLPRRQLTSPLETAFSKQQLQTSLLIGTVCLMAAIFLSILMARGLLEPIRRMIDAVAQLSRGDYTPVTARARGDELGQLTKDLDKLALTLRQSRDARRRWLADISHELRTPLTILTGEIEALKDGLRNFDKTQLMSLDQEVQRLAHLVNDLYQLALSDIGGMRYSMEEIALDQWLLEWAQQGRHRASACGLELSISTVPAVVRADPGRLDQLMANLLENALAYTDSPGRITIEMGVNNASVTIRFSDTAPGPDDAQCQQLFDPLYRAEASRNRRSGGAGLGLAICRNIVEAHGGTICATPSSGKGLCVTITLGVITT